MGAAHVDVEEVVQGRLVGDRGEVEHGVGAGERLDQRRPVADVDPGGALAVALGLDRFAVEQYEVLGVGAQPRAQDGADPSRRSRHHDPARFHVHTVERRVAPRRPRPPKAAGRRCAPHLAMRSTRSMIRSPTAAVRMDSGWNCTAHRRASGASTAITTGAAGSSVTAVTVNPLTRSGVV